MESCLDKYNIIEKYDITIYGQKIQPIYKNKTEFCLHLD